MKWLAVLLLIANLCLSGWYFNRHMGNELHMSSADAEQPPALPAGLPQLTLLSELQNGESTLPAVSDTRDTETMTPATGAAATPDEVADETSDPDRNRVCYSIGPFTSAGATKEVDGWLQEHALDVRNRVQEQRISTRFWVFLEPDDDPEKTRLTLEELGRKGFKDYMLIKQGDMKNAISLGVFSAQESVNRRLAEMQREGYTPVVVPRHRTRQYHWLDFAAGNDFDLLELPYPDAPSTVDCERFDHSGASP